MSLTGTTRFVSQTAVCSALPVARLSSVHHTCRQSNAAQVQQDHPAARVHGLQSRQAPSTDPQRRKATVAAAAGVAKTITDARDFAIAMAKIADDTKASDLSVLHVEPLVSWTSYMVICTVMSRPQLLAVLARMEDAAKDEWDRVKQNSAGSSQWEVMDFGDVVVHVFTSEQREHYDLDGFYAAAEEVLLPFVEDQDRNSSSAIEQSSKSRSAVASAMWSKNLLSI